MFLKAKELCIDYKIEIILKSGKNNKSYLSLASLFELFLS